jgi:hypothetical protein
MEYRPDLYLYAAFPGGTQSVVAPVAGGDTTSWSHGVAGEFSYVF